MKFRIIPVVLCLLLCGWQASAQTGPVQFQLTIEPLPGDFAKLEPVIREHILTAAQMWVDHVECKPCAIEIIFRLQPWNARGFGHSLAGVPIEEKVNGRPLVEEGWGARTAHGRRSQRLGSTPDVEMAFDPEYFKTLWWDPHPNSRHAVVPKDKLDAMSVVLHELGHAIAFNGRLDPKTGKSKDGSFRPMTNGLLLMAQTYSSTAQPR